MTTRSLRLIERLARLCLAPGCALVLVVALAPGCNLHRMTGETMVEYTQEHAVPYLMSSRDVGAACEMGISMGGFLMSFERLDVETDKAAGPTLLSAAMCAEADAWEAELRRLRALYEGRQAEARDAGYAAKQAHFLAAVRNHAAFQATIAAYGHPDDGCPTFETSRDEALYLLGLAAGTLGVLHDRQAGGAANIPLDIPPIVARGAACLDSDRWWGLPDAIRASIWLSMPTGPSDAWETLQRAAQRGDEAGVSMARALLVQTAQATGQHDVMCEAVAGYTQGASGQRSDDWAMLDAYGELMLRHAVNVQWTTAVGHRAAPGELACYAAPAPEDEAGDDMTDDLLEGLGDDVLEVQPGDPSEDQSDAGEESPDADRPPADAGAGLEGTP